MKKPWASFTRWLPGLAVVAMLAPQVRASELYVANYGAPSVLGQQGNRNARVGRFPVSDDGRYVVFTSSSNNFSADNGGARSDVWLKDTHSGDVTRVSRRSDGGALDASSLEAAISGDGRWVAYVSQATNVTAEPTQGIHLYLFDRISGQTQRVTPSPMNWPGVTSFLTNPVLSFDGSHVAFETEARLLPGDVDFQLDAYRWTRQSGEFTRLSVDSAGQSLGGIYNGTLALSADAQHASFMLRTDAAGGGLETRIYVRDVAASTTDFIASASSGPRSVPTSLSADARYVAFDIGSALVPADSNGVDDVYVFDRVTRQAERVSVGSNGSGGAGASTSAMLSRDGRQVVFRSAANLDGGEPGSFIYRRDRQTGVTTRLAPATLAMPFDDPGAALSGDGTRVVFATDDGLEAADDNRRGDVYAVDADGAHRVSTTHEAPRAAGATTPQQLIRDSGGAFVLADGSIAYASGADNLGALRRPAIFRFNLATAQTSEIALDALNPFPAYPVYLALAGASRDGSRYLVRREPLHLGAGWGLPPPPAPWDVWRVGAGGAQRLDDPAVVGAGARTTQAMMSDDGRFALFVSRVAQQAGPTLIRLFLHDADNGSWARADVNAANEPADAPVQPRAGLSRNGRYTAFVAAANNLVANDADGSMDLFLRDNFSGAIERLRDPHSGAPLVHATRSDSDALVVSDDGQRIAFTDPVGTAPLVRVLLLDRGTGEVRTIANGETGPIVRELSMSADGEMLAFTSPWMLQDDGDSDTDIYSYRVSDGLVRLESIDGDGAPGSGQRSFPRLSADGSALTFQAQGSGWRTKPQVTGERDWVFKRFNDDPIFANGFEAVAR